MSPDGSVSDAYVRRRTGSALLVAEAGLVEPLCHLGLEQSSGWEHRLDALHGSSGRGTTVVVKVEGRALRLKQLRRGGLAAALWRDRFPGTGRILGNLEIPCAARRRGVATPPVVALLMVAGPPGLYRGWLAVEEIPDGEDLMARFRRQAVDDDDLTAALAAVRKMHDAGIEHRDLNLGNLLVVPGPDGVRGWVLDLDGARVHDAALGFRARQRGLRRLERSLVRTLPPGGDTDRWRDRIYQAYADGNAEMAGALAAGRAAGRLWLGLRGGTRPRRS